ncbi:MAG: ester cyclase [Anaerolineae bacterium]|nr:ester cyclase [Anaerolineae bacterium]
MSTEENKALVRRWVEETWNKGDLVTTSGLIVPDLIVHETVIPHVADLNGFGQFIILARTACPDLLYTVEEMFAEGNEVVTRWTLRGEHTGEWGGVSPTNKQVTMTGFAKYRLANGKIAEIWTDLRRSDLMEEIGIVSPQPWRTAWRRLTPGEKREAFLEIAREMMTNMKATEDR